MSRTTSGWIRTALAGVVRLSSAVAQGPSPPSLPGAAYRGALDRYCVTCHNEKRKTANLMLDKVDVADTTASTEIWEKVIRKLRTRTMPPTGAPHPDQATYDAFASYLENNIDRNAAANPNPGRVAAIHRLNRTEYENAVRDLLALRIDGESLLPADESSAGFDNNADVLAVSPAILDRYMSAARQISRMAVGDLQIRPSSQIFNVADTLAQDERMSEDLPFGSRGGSGDSLSLPGRRSICCQDRPAKKRRA